MVPVAAKDWFEIRHVSNGVSLLREKYVADWLRCNIWFIQGRDRNLVIDSGMGLSPLTPMLLSLSELPVTAVMTHCHFDHMGGAHEFEHRLGHRACSDVYHDPMPSFSQTGGAAFVRAETFNALPHTGFTFESYMIRPAPLTGYLDEGDIVDLGNRTFQVFYLPGLGRLVFQSISQRDLIVVESVVMLLVFAVILVNFIVDLAYAWVDPRLRSRT